MSEANSKIFMAQIEKELKSKGLRSDAEPSEMQPTKLTPVDEFMSTVTPIAQTNLNINSQPIIVEPEKPKGLDYDHYENEVDESEANGKTLKDFFQY